MTDAEAVRYLLDALEVAPGRIPLGVEAQASLYRSLVASRRMLVVLDNARDAEQIRQILPGSSGSFTLVTSRTRLAALTSLGACLVVLDLPTRGEARELVARHVGPDRIVNESTAVDEIVDRCTRLPLALTLVASRAATHPSFPLAALADELREAGLDALDRHEAYGGVRAVFSWSYKTLDDEAARTFRFLGLHPGPEIGVDAVGSLLDCSVREARIQLSRLAEAHLVQEAAAGRFALHDLLLAFATELSESADTEADRRAALGRLLAHYIQLTYTAMRVLQPHRDLPTPPGGSNDSLFAGPHRAAVAQKWLIRESPALLRSVQAAYRHGFDAEAWQLASSLSVFLDIRCLWSEWTSIEEVALRAAGRLDDVAKRAASRRSLARARAFLGDTNGALDLLDKAVVDHQRLGDLTGEAKDRHVIARVYDLMDNPQAALDQFDLAIARFRVAGEVTWLAAASSSAGWCHARLGHYNEASASLRTALVLMESLGDRLGQARTWDSIGYVHLQTGRYAEAIDCYRQALSIFREISYQYGQSQSLTTLGDAQLAAGSPAIAKDTWRQALDLLRELGHPDAEQVLARIEAVPPA
jgi:tetratricopeptide (TPR) repeat protein